MKLNNKGFVGIIAAVALASTVGGIIYFLSGKSILCDIEKYQGKIDTLQKAKYLAEAKIDDVKGDLKSCKTKRDFKIKQVKDASVNKIARVKFKSEKKLNACKAKTRELKKNRKRCYYESTKVTITALETATDVARIKAYRLNEKLDEAYVLNSYYKLMVIFLVLLNVGTGVFLWRKLR